MPAYSTGAGENKKGVKYETENVALTIEEFSKKKNIPVDKIDFELISVITSVRKTETIGNLTEEVVVFEKRDIPNITDKLWLDPDIRISQKYEILLTPFDNNAIHIHIGVGANQYLTNVAAFVKKDPSIIPESNLENFLIYELNKKKIRHGFLINIYDSQMRHDIGKLSNFIYQHGKLDKDVKLSLFSGPDFTPSQDDRLEFTYKNKSTLKDSAKYVGVGADDVLVEYFKPMFGKASRNARGKYINCYEPIKVYNIDFTPSSAVKIVEKEDRTSFLAAHAGFAVLEDKILDVKSELLLENLTAKTGSIDVGSNQTAKLEICSQDPNMEAIGDNVRLSAFDISVKGSIGADTYLECDKITITGQTHMSSKIIAKHADIKTLKGYLSAEFAKVGVLENGEVDAKSAHITSSLGSKINATDCKIDILGSNSTITVSKQLVIDNISGSENKIVVTPVSTKAEAEDFSDLVEQLKEINQLLLDTEGELEKNVKDVEQGFAGAKAIKSKIDAEADKAKVAPLIAKLRAFNELVEKTKAIKKEFEEIMITKKSLVQTIQAKQDTILQARVIAMQNWRGHNTIKFKLVEPAMELSITVDEKNNYREVFLQKVNDVYSIGYEAR